MAMSAESREAVKNNTTLDRHFEQRPPRYCNLSLRDDWLNEVRYHPVEPLTQPRAKMGWLWGMSLTLIILASTPMVAYSVAMLRFSLWTGVGLIPLVASQLAYTPNITITDGSSYQVLSGQAQWNPFGYAEVVDIQNTSLSSPSDVLYTQYAQASDISHSSCTYTIISDVTSFGPKTLANDRKYEPLGTSQLTLPVPACSALYATGVCWIALLVATFVGGIVLLCGSLGGEIRQQLLVNQLRVDLRATPNDPIDTRALDSDRKLFEHINETTPVPARAALPSEREMGQYTCRKLSKLSSRWEKARLVAQLVPIAVVDVLAVATLASSASVVSDSGFVGRGTGPLLPLLLVSCLMPLVVGTTGVVLHVLVVRRLQREIRELMREYGVGDDDAGSYHSGIVMVP